MVSDLFDVFGFLAHTNQVRLFRRMQFGLEATFLFGAL
jgi:hypothetical protein